VSLSKDELLDLMAYADGEVEGSKLTRVEALLAKSDPARRFLEQQRALHHWVLDSRSASATMKGANGIADAVMATLGQSSGAAIVSPAVTTLESARTRRTLSRRLIPWVGPLAAIAASIALFCFWPPAHPDSRAPVASREGDPTGAPPPASPAPPPTTPDPVAAIEPQRPGIDIVALESPKHQFSIFYVPGAAGESAQASSVVVWIGEE
jgi:hypothetical protein